MSSFLIRVFVVVLMRMREAYGMEKSKKFEIT